jgi:ABC-type antimicrobial peptide transport system permease subunit
MKKLVATTVMGLLFGTITGIMYGVSTENWPGAGWMFLTMVGFVYVIAIMLWLIFAFDEWING